MIPVRVLVVGSSARVRECLRENIMQDTTLELVGAALDATSGVQKAVRLEPDVILLGTDGIQNETSAYLHKLIPLFGRPVVLLGVPGASHEKTIIRGLESGAVDFVVIDLKENEKLRQSALLELRTKVKIASTVHVTRLKHTVPSAGRYKSGEARKIDVNKFCVIAIGASTGGTEAIYEIIRLLPAETPPVLVVQHMPPDFTRMFAQRMDGLCALNVREAADGDPVVPGTVLVAPGGFHMELTRADGTLRVCIKDGDLVNGHRPSVDVLMRSVASVVGRQAIGVILTGMGTDGAEGLLAMRSSGARTLAQDEESSIIFGMPGAAAGNGGAEELVPLERMAEMVLKRLGEMTG